MLKPPTINLGTGNNQGTTREVSMDETKKKSGAELIADERRRQIEAEGFTVEHDQQWTKAQLARAGREYVTCYIGQAAGFQPIKKWVAMYWPWAPEWWKPSDDPIRNLVKAGALLAAEIDRVNRMVEKAKA